MRFLILLLFFLLSFAPVYAAQTFFEKGLDAFEKENYKQAIALYTKQLKNKSGANVLFNRGLAYYALQDYPAALEDFTLVIAKDPTDFEAWYNRGLTHFYHGDIEKAISDSEESLLLNPNYGNALTTLGMCYYKIGKYSEALIIFDSILQIKESALSYYNRALTFNKLGQTSAAENDFSKAIKMEPTVRYYWGRADFYYNHKNYQKSIEDYDAALLLDSTNAMLYYNRGLSYYADFKEEKAIADLMQVLAIDSNDIDAKWYLCASHYALGNYEEALAYYNEVESLNLNYGLLNNISKKELERKTLLQNNLVYVVLILLLAILIAFFAIRLFKRKEVPV